MKRLLPLATIPLFAGCIGQTQQNYVTCSGLCLILWKNPNDGIVFGLIAIPLALIALVAGVLWMTHRERM